VGFSVRADLIMYKGAVKEVLLKYPAS